MAGRQHGVIALPVRSNDSALSSNAGRVFQGYRPEISGAPNGRFRTVGPRIWRVGQKFCAWPRTPVSSSKPLRAFAKKVGRIWKHRADNYP